MTSRVDRRQFLSGLFAAGALLMSARLDSPARAKMLFVEPSDDADASPPSELLGLLRYLGLDYATFSAHEDRYFDALRDLLAYNGMVGATDKLDRTNYQDAVLRFQGSRSLLMNGIPDEDTLWELQSGRAKSRRLRLVDVAADVWPGRPGLKSTPLRQDAAAAYNQLRDEVKALGGVMTSDGSLRGLTAEVSAGRSSTSLHYTGLAFDLSTSTGMRDPETDPYIVTGEWPGWHVWARASGGIERELDAVVWRDGRVVAQRVSARVIDLTTAAVRHGFIDIGFRYGFPDDYSCAEWWHFQYEAALVPCISQFGAELLSLSIYSEDKLKAVKSIWDSRKLIRNRGRDGWVSTPGPAR